MRCASRILSLGLAAFLFKQSAAIAAVDFEIPVVNSLSGQGAFLGENQKRTLEILEKLVDRQGGVHGRNVHFTFHDDQSSPQVAVQLTSAIVGAGAVAMLGSSLAGTCNAMAPLVAHGPVDYCFSAGMQPKEGSNIFSAGVSTHAQAEALLKYFQGRGWKRIALFTGTDASGQDGDRAFETLLSSPDFKDIQLVAHVAFNLSDVSVSGQMQTIVAAKPDALVAWTVGRPAGTIFRGMLQAGLDVPVGTDGGNMSFAQMQQFTSFLPAEIYMMNPEWTAAGDPHFHLDPRVEVKQKEFYSLTRQAGIGTDAPAVVAWDPASILVDGLRALPENVTADQLRQWIAVLTNYAGVQGVYNFLTTPQRGLDVSDVLVTRWQAKENNWRVVSEPGGAPLKN